MAPSSGEFQRFLQERRNTQQGQQQHALQHNTQQGLQGQQQYALQQEEFR